MKNKIIAAIMLITVLFTAACTGQNISTTTTGTPGSQVPPAPEKHQVIVSGEDFSGNSDIVKQVEVNAGDSFSIVLDSNRTTGYQWNEQAEISDMAVIEQTVHNYVAPNVNNEIPVVGMAGFENWTFKALKTGTATINLSYSRPWEGGEKDTRTFELKVVIR